MVDFGVDQQQLISAVTGLGTPFRFERSFRLSSAGLFANRCLMSVTKDAIGPSPNDAILGICHDLLMPDPVLQKVSVTLDKAEFVHWGLEGDAQQRICKFYLEFPNRRSELDPGHEPVLLHVAYKWNPDTPAAAVQTHYQLFPRIDLVDIQARLKNVYGTDSSTPSLDIVGSVLRKAAERVPIRELDYLEVNEETNSRRSFDLNLYDTGMTIADLRDEIVMMGKRFSQDQVTLATFVDQIRLASAGHIAAGTHRNGHDFFNVYYGAETWSENGFGEKPNVAEVSQKTCSNLAESWQEYTAPGDSYFNYCWWPYTPVASVQHKLRPVNLLYQSFDLAGIGKGAFDIVQSIQSEIGSFRTVWGIKLIDDQLAWEFYLYDYQRRSRDISITRVLDAIAQIAPCPFRVNEMLPYFMFSIDIDAALIAGQRDVEVVHTYIGNPGSTVSSGIAYAITATEKTLENFYFFFDGRRQLGEVADKITSSVHLDDTQLDVNNILRPELRDCHTICVANKQSSDTVYFSGVTVDQLIFFLNWLQYPEPIRSYVESHREKLDHLLFDVGFDYTTTDDEIHVLKSGYYGVF